MTLIPKYSQLKTLLNSANKVVESRRIEETQKGINFNIFSVLKMETRENETHSAFLRELLNPKGSHGKGALFLQLFLDYLKVKHIDTQSVHVKVEHTIGRKDIDNETGGRIDIYILDKNGNSISIENKIHAREQDGQIKRYCNYNKGKNKVYYLTLFGDEATSNGEFVSGKDFHLISYKTDIANWLSQCMIAVTETPRLKESIGQYLQLIQKLTFTMENKYENELTDLMVNNFESASFIHANYELAKNSIADKFRKELVKVLNSCIDTKVYEIEIGDAINTEYAQVWINLIGVEKSKLYFGIESFNGRGHSGGKLFIGIFYPFDKTQNERSDFFDLEDNTPKDNWWTNVKDISPFEEFEINFGNPVLLSKIHLDNNFKIKMIEHIANEVKEYVYEHTGRIIEFERRMNNDKK